MPLQGKAEDWKGKEFRRIGTRSVVQVKEIGRGYGGQRVVDFIVTQNPNAPDRVGQQSRVAAEHFRSYYVPHDPQDPLEDVPVYDRGDPDQRKQMPRDVH